jgi:hypothetical protein
MAANAILAISSTDRYITNLGGNANQPFSNTLEAQFDNAGPFSNDFSIIAPNALMNGYIDAIKISQIQLQYNLPTIIPDGNDLMIVGYETSPQSGVFAYQQIGLPYGFYTPAEIAALLETELNTYIPSLQPWVVTFTSSIGVDFGFSVLSNNQDGLTFFFPRPSDLRIPSTYVLSETEITRYLKTCKLLGFNTNNGTPQVIQGQVSWAAPDFLYTPYIDIYSDALTNYQKLKDTDSSTSRRKGLITRLYLSGVGNPQITSTGFVNENSLTIVPSTALGCSPFVLTFDLNTPKIINWSPDTAVNSLDFQMRDCYGDLLFNYIPSTSPGLANEVFNTEFQMTLLCVERD